MVAKNTELYNPKNHVRIVTAASLFDGHDAAINVMRRIIQQSGVEVIHLGHNRSVAEIVTSAIQEDVQGIALTSYQGGHTEFFKYMYDLLKEQNANIKIFGGGGGTILPSEVDELHDYGITKIYSPDDGRTMGLSGMISDVVKKSDFPKFRIITDEDFADLSVTRPDVIAALISAVENSPEQSEFIKNSIKDKVNKKIIPVLGVTGTGGSGKSSLVDELVRRFITDFNDKYLAIISVDPSKRRTGGALLGDRIRMNSIYNSNIYMRSLATRQSNLALSNYVQESIDICKAAGFDFIIVETSGIGQSDTEIIDHSDVSLYVMTAEYGAATQLEKIDMLDYADIIAINKFDHRGSLDALRDVKKQYKRNHEKWTEKDENLPIFGTIASQFNDAGINQLYLTVLNLIKDKTSVQYLTTSKYLLKNEIKKSLIPSDRVRYLAEIAENNHSYSEFTQKQSQIASKLYQLAGCINIFRLKIRGCDYLNKVKSDENILLDIQYNDDDTESIKILIDEYLELNEKIDFDCKKLLGNWNETVDKYTSDYYSYKVRDKVFKQELYSESLSHLKIPKVCLPKYKDWGEILSWQLTENIPGKFPYAAGVFPLKRVGEDPARMFAGEGGPEKTNKRFHYLSMGLPAKRLSTAFDSVTLYGEDPDHRPDIYGKIGNSGVSVATLDDAKKLYSGFNLASNNTSVSMTINGPAPIMLGFFMNAAIDQQCEIYIKNNGLEKQVNQKINKIYAEKNMERPCYNGDLPKTNDGLGLFLLGVTGDEVLDLKVYNKIKQDTLKIVRGTVQADILKEDQAQNTCIFSTEFALRMMGDIQQYFINENVRNFYSVSISGYHIAEAGANPITQLALTLANGFTFVEYYLSRGMDINDFAPNLSFFFSNGTDVEYSVLGRVARKIWAKAIKNKYKGNSRSQKLKYHIQTSGRSLHAQEIGFNDIRTTLQALYAIYDNCNSLHTNAYDEAITTPTEESVRRALAIQLIINKELGMSKNENPLQGSFIIEELTNLVEEAVLSEFKSISERGGVLGAMERMYQRSKIQEESLFYETLKHDGKLPIVGVNTFLDTEGSPTVIPGEIRRSTENEKEFAISSLNAFKARNVKSALKALVQIQKSAITFENIFEQMMETAKTCTLGQISKALYEVGGQYRRNM